MTIKGVFFDLDGTLIPRQPTFERYVRSLAHRCPHPFAAPEAQQRFRELDQGGRCARDQFCRLVAEEFPELGWSPAQVWQDFADGMAEAVQPDEGTLGLVGALSRRMPVAIISNGSSRRQREKIRRAQLEPWIPVVVISEEVGSEKPDPAIFEYTLDTVGLPAEEALYIGDNPQQDIVGAHSVGMHSCWISAGDSYPEGLPGPTLTVPQLSQLTPERVSQLS